MSLLIFVALLLLLDVAAWMWGGTRENGATGQRGHIARSEPVITTRIHEWS